MRIETQSNMGCWHLGLVNAVRWHSRSFEAYIIDPPFDVSRPKSLLLDEFSTCFSLPLPILITSWTFFCHPAHPCRRPHRSQHMDRRLLPHPLIPHQHLKRRHAM